MHEQLAIQIAALRRELRADAFARLAASARNDSSREDYISTMHQHQGAADQIAMGSLENYLAALTVKGG